MGKLQLVGFLVLLGIFLAIFFVIQRNNSQKSTNPNLSLNQFTGGQPSQSAQTQQQVNQQQVQQVPPTTAPTIHPSYTLDEIKTASFTATIKTSKGDLTLDLFGKDAPQTVQMFITKAKTGFYNNLTFHRVLDFVAQGGDPTGTGSGGDSEPVEFNDKPFVPGSLGQASTGDGQTQNASQFFIVKTDASWLNGKYTNYGMVTKGMDVVNKIAQGDKILSITIEKQ